MTTLLELILHLPDHLLNFTQQYGMWIYVLLFIIIFCETGLVVLPFLPGDSLIFAVGAIAAMPNSGLNPYIAGSCMIVACLLGDATNYHIGKYGSDWMQKKFPRIVKPKHIEKTTQYFNTYGKKTIIIARFVPIVRTFCPFVAGSTKMNFQLFMRFNVIGALLWVGLIMPVGYFFGAREIVRSNFELIVLAIVGISLLPMIFEVIRNAYFKKTKA